MRKALRMLMGKKENTTWVEMHPPSVTVRELPQMFRLCNIVG
jgi:mannose/fructose-specific phosphotransferase system component IIA